MIRHIHQRLKDYQDRLGARFGSDISTPTARRAARWHFILSDHAFLRVLWTNLYPIAPGVWRSNQPSPRQLTALAGRGIRTVLNLRGASRQSFWLFEREACTSQGLTLHNLGMSARSAPNPKTLLDLHHLLTTIERPMLIHCKSGADRTGLAAALYLIWVEGRPLHEAQRQLSWRYVHRSTGPTGILDHFLRVYGRRNAEAPIPLLDWIKTEYDPAALTASYKRWQAGGKEAPW
jgi:protein tyrosine phosphatase (PTP) superfamily phosphohydrolase (DUF442 family)